MKVKVANNLYKMGKTEYENLRDTVAKKEVPFGIYAVERGNYAELRNDRCESITQLKKMRQGYRSQGFKVYENRDRG